jgi:hypothetical protein
LAGGRKIIKHEKKQKTTGISQTKAHSREWERDVSPYSNGKLLTVEWRLTKKSSRKSSLPNFSILNLLADTVPER